MAKSSRNDQPEESIIVAAEQGRLDLVTNLLESGADPNTVDDIGTSALHNAAKEGHWHIARLLLEKNASPRILDGHNVTPLHRAIKAGHTQIVRLILDCDPTICESVVDPTKLLCIAANCGYSEITQILLAYNIPSLDKSPGITALHCAAKYYTGATPFLYAFEKRHHRTVEVFLRHYPDLTKAYDQHKVLLFHEAVRTLNIEMTRIFLDNGADIEMENRKGSRPLHVVVTASLNYSHYSENYLNEIIEMIQFLLARGAAVDVKDKDGYTPEFHARDPKIRMLLRNHEASGGDRKLTLPQTSAPPPEYKE
ncbi:hypothetical protein N7462_006950 [Penicillium macrosclerotiorum]|uniref:uncharacterized protein n=1 Tax=Penicillium macrosclerotiorum TaxID=303699 RepID=UPI0025476AED|nr:uncharacterized protein N7462_006950 [Penicillium macrosclerotiorum]KAJ5678706.1 hypothetical protein N7462_006950 [Penicillium macrosclerotiorum]